MISKCVQYGVWTNCSNKCDFCLLRQKGYYTKQQQIFWLEKIIENIKILDWKKQYTGGISLLGGQLYFIKDKAIQDKFMELVDVIIQHILKVSDDPACKYSTVTNGLYKPDFLYRVIDRIVDSVGLYKVDVNFSFDFKYRFANEKAKELCLNNIRAFRDRYNYRVGVQMILTQYVIDMWKRKQFDVNQWIKNNINDCNLAFLYPHPVRTGKILPDFKFCRSDLIKFVQYLKNQCPDVYHSFVHSTKNSERFKYTGLITKKPGDTYNKTINIYEQPILADGKQIKCGCGHSILYRCYSDSDKCIMCDLQMIDGDLS